MKYYLETNALYNLKNIPDDVKTNSFTSIYALSELITGISDETFSKRRSILNQLDRSGIPIDQAFPQEIIFNSFDAFEDYEFIEQRDESLNNLFQAILKSESISQFRDSPSYANGQINFDYFKIVDEHQTQNFVESTITFNTILAEEIVKEPNSSILYDDTTYDLGSKKSVEEFLITVPEFNRSATILAVTNMISRFTKVKIPIKEIYESYNGLINPYIEIFSRFVARKTGESGKPGKNDFQDLTHLLYLRNEPARKIVSNDNLFRKFAPEYIINH